MKHVIVIFEVKDENWSGGVNLIVLLLFSHQSRFLQYAFIELRIRTESYVR